MHTDILNFPLIFPSFLNCFFFYHRSVESSRKGVDSTPFYVVDVDGQNELEKHVQNHTMSSPWLDNRKGVYNFGMGEDMCPATNV